MKEEQLHERLGKQIAEYLFRKHNCGDEDNVVFVKFLESQFYRNSEAILTLILCAKVVADQILLEQGYMKDYIVMPELTDDKSEVPNISGGVCNVFANKPMRRVIIKSADTEEFKKKISNVNSVQALLKMMEDDIKDKEDKNED